MGGPGAPHGVPCGASRDVLGCPVGSWGALWDVTGSLGALYGMLQGLGVLQGVSGHPAEHCRLLGCRVGRRGESWGTLRCRGVLRRALTPPACPQA